MGRPLWSTVYKSRSTETPTKHPGKWSSTNNFDPDSDAFFFGAELEVPIADAPIMIEPDTTPSSFDWTAASSVERLNSLAELVAERRRELLDVMVRRRRIEALDSIRRAREAIATQRQTQRGESLPGARESSTSSGNPSAVIPSAGYSSGTPLSPLGESRLAELQNEPESDEEFIEVPMRFGPPVNRRSQESSLSSNHRNTSRRLSDHAARQAFINSLREENREVALEIERRRNRLREQAQNQRLEDEGSSVDSTRISSLSLSRQRRETLYSRLSSAPGQPGLRSRVLSTPPHTTTSASEQAAASLELETEAEIRRSMAIAQSVFRRQRHREMEARNRIPVADFGLS
ncbi:hypothetical protein EV368DRAFT_86620 [Lentinula lateritia]|nr:hypothetical protein EV368DRAFT_86620 [Lentinula lateritia]